MSNVRSPLEKARAEFSDTPSKSSTKAPATNTSDSTTTLTKVATETVRIGIIGSGVAAVLYPADILLQRAQTKSSRLPINNESRFTKGTILASSRSLARGLNASMKASTVKNGMIAQRETVDGWMERETIEREGILEEKTSASSLARTATISGALGIAETLFTNYPRNVRTWNIHATYHREFTAPNIFTLEDMIKATWIGFPTRTLSNVFTVAGLLLTTQIKASFSNSLPVYAWADMNHVAATGVSASTVGVATNALGVLYANQAVRVDPKTLVSPSCVVVTKELIAKEGIKVFFRGFPISILYTGIAYFTIPKMEAVADKIVPSIERYFRSCTSPSNSFSSMVRDRFFQPSTNTSTKEPLLVDSSVPAASDKNDDTSKPKIK